MRAVTQSTLGGRRAPGDPVSRAQPPMYHTQQPWIIFFHCCFIFLGRIIILPWCSVIYSVVITRTGEAVLCEETSGWHVSDQTHSNIKLKLFKTFAMAGSSPITMDRQHYASLQLKNKRAAMWYKWSPAGLTTPPMTWAAPPHVSPVLQVHHVITAY